MSAHYRTVPLTIPTPIQTQWWQVDSKVNVTYSNQLTQDKTNTYSITTGGIRKCGTIQVQLTFTLFFYKKLQKCYQKKTVSIPLFHFITSN